MKEYVIISPYSKKLRNNNNNPKNYPYWKKLIPLIHYHTIQVGIDGEEPLVEDFRKNLSLKQLELLVLNCKTWISVDSFFQHFCWDLNKQGIVLWGPSDPLIFGHPENINLLKDRKYLVENQFLWWEQHSYDENRFISPEEVIAFLK